MPKYIQTSGLKEKTYPNIGDKLYLRQFTGDEWADMVKRPYTVIEVTPSRVKVQECKLIAPVYHCKGNPMTDMPHLEGKRVFFFNTIAESIEEDKEGRIEELTWHPKRGLWGTKGREADYPQYAIMGEWIHQPYLN